MTNIAREIKKRYEEFKKNGPHGPVCKTLPFLPVYQQWMYHYLYPITTSGEARIYPCWVLPKGEVLRIMEECGIILREES